MAKYQTKERDPMFDATEANCAKTNPDTFFPEGAKFLSVTREAKAVCAACPIVNICLDYAIKNDEWGIWGGATRKERIYLGKNPGRKRAHLQLLLTFKGAKDLIPTDDENKMF